MVYESSIPIRGEEYPIVFNGYALREIQNKFGKLANLKTAMVVDEEPNFEAISNVASILLEAGQRYCKTVGKDCPPPLRPWEDVLDLSDMSLLEKLFETISKGMEREIETVSKNSEAKQTN